MSGSKQSGPIAERDDDNATREGRLSNVLAQTDHEKTIDSHGTAVAVHVARGSAYLRNDRVLQAKEELERAINLDPHEPRVRDLLAAVYFRLGVYGSAVQLYEHLRDQYPRDAIVKVNLALAYMKAHLLDAARVQLEDVVRANPHHRRAWGYLAVAYRRLGAEALAIRAFERGKLPDGERLTVPAPAVDDEDAFPSKAIPPSMNSRGFVELDGGELMQGLDEAGAHATRDDDDDDEHATAPPPPDVIHPESLRPSPSPPPEPRPPQGAPPPQSPASVSRTVDRVSRARSGLLAFPAAPGVARDTTGLTGLVAVRLIESGPNGEGFAARLESLQSFTAGLRNGVLERQVKNRTTPEPFGGFGAPLVRFEGAGDLVLAPRAGHSFCPLDLDNERAVFREELIAGFELRMSYENVRVPIDEGDGIAMVEIRGSGALLIESACELRAIEVTGGRAVGVRRDVVAGFIGPLAARAMPTREAPAGQAGLALVEGDGLLFLMGR